ncbi:MAG: type IV pilin protein [Methylobacter sp.]
MKTKIRGFTLLELMIAVAIVGLLAAIAVPSYRAYITAGKRAEAQGALVAFANAMEQWRLQNGNYCDAGGAGGANTCGVAGTNDTGSPSIFSTVVPISGGTTTYNLTISAMDAAGSTYTLTATATGAQTADGNLSLTSTGTKSCTVASSCLNGSSW